MNLLTIQIINEGAEYNLRVSMARAKRSVEMWENLTRRWSKTYNNMADQKFTVNDAKKAAKELKAYYEEHVKEIDSV